VNALRGNFEFGRKREFDALRDISFDIYPGEFVGIMGRNGAGKTSTLRSIMGLVPRRTGSVRYDGKEFVNARPDVIAQNAHRLLGAARTLGAISLCAQLNEFQKLQPRDSSIFYAQNTEALKRVIKETDIALQHLEAFFQAALVREEV
jgi:ABC-type multidrug transport system ATPase subunit